MRRMSQHRPFIQPKGGRNTQTHAKHARASYSYTTEWRKEYLDMRHHATVNSASSFTAIRRKEQLIHALYVTASCIYTAVRRKEYLDTCEACKSIVQLYSQAEYLDIDRRATTICSLIQLEHSSLTLLTFILFRNWPKSLKSHEGGIGPKYTVALYFIFISFLDQISSFTETLPTPHFLAQQPNLEAQFSPILLQ